MALGLLALAAVGAAHTVQLEHGGARIEAEYHARTEIQRRTIGAYTPNRMNVQRCMWTAIVAVDRRLAGNPALARTVASDLRLSGSLPGACQGKADAVAREVARRDDKIRAHVVAAAAQDRPQLLAELEGARNLASDWRPTGM